MPSPLECMCCSSVSSGSSRETWPCGYSTWSSASVWLVGWGGMVGRSVMSALLFKWEEHGLLWSDGV